jgi:hypothetical protein
VGAQDELWQAMANNKSGESNSEKKEKSPQASPKLFSFENTSKDNKSSDNDNDNDNEKEEENDKEDADQDSQSEKHFNKIVPVTTLTETALPSGEENETCLYKGRAKIYRFKTNNDEAKEGEAPPSAQNALEKAEWCEIGTGPIKILCQDKDSDNTGHKDRIVGRREDKKGGIGKIAIVLFLFLILCELILYIFLSFRHTTDVKSSLDSICFRSETW